MPDLTTEEIAPAEPKTPWDFLALFPNAPTQQAIEAMRMQVPGGRLRLLPMKDGKRLFLLRAFTALEMISAQAEAGKVAPEKQLAMMQSILVTRCILWNSINGGKLTEADLMNSGAGLASTLYHAIADLSDFVEPQFLEQLFVDF
jgi:hypothetical protein